MNGVSGVNNYPAYGSFASGKKINTAADGAAELSVIERQSAQIGGMDAGAGNMKSGQEAMNISDGALGHVSDALQRMRELALQAKNGTYGMSERKSIQAEIDQLKKGIANIAGTTDYNTHKLLDGSETKFEMAVNAEGSTKSFETVDATLESLGIGDFDVTSGDFDLSVIDKALDQVNSARGKMGAQSNSFDYALAYNANASYNLTSSVSRTEDLDVPAAISDKKKQQTLQEYSLLMQRKKMEDEQNKVRNLFV